jgi:hypothetical protein
MAQRLGRWRRLWAAILLIAAFFETSVAVATPAAPANRIDPASIYVLAIGACPPWRPIKVCRHDVMQFAEAARDLMGVPANQITTLVNEQATADGVRMAIAELRSSMPRGSAVVAYYIGHGMLMPKGGKAGAEAEETLLLWSDSFPFAALYAVQASIWMTGSELGRLIATLPAASTLVILDTCEAAGANGAVLSQPALRKGEQIALMSSSRAHEIAFADLTSAVFTRNLVEAMRTTSTMHDAFLEAQQETEAEAALRCEAATVSGALGEVCTPQDPTLVDPSGLTQRIVLE